MDAPEADLPGDLPLVERDAVRLVGQETGGAVLRFWAREFTLPEVGSWCELPGAWTRGSGRGGGDRWSLAPERAFRNVEVRCRLRVPEGSLLATKTASAEVRSSIALGAFDRATASGDVELTGVSGDVTHRSASGGFTCETVGGRLHVRTASGDVSVRKVSGDVELALASGDVDLGEAAGSVDVKSASGDVRLGRVHRGRVRAQTASGDVRIGVAEGVGAYLDVTTVSGDTRCTLPFQERAPDAAAVLELVARTVSGDIVVEGAGR